MPSPTVRCLVLGDTHGHLDERIAAACREADLVVHTGDVGSTAVLDMLQAGGAELVAVGGNNDVRAKWLDTWPGELPERAEVDLPSGQLVVEHGHRAGPAARRHARLRQQHPQARAIAIGHSHHALVDKEARPWVLNPGAAGRVRTFGGPSYIVLSATARRWTARLVRLPPA